MPCSIWGQWSGSIRSRKGGALRAGLAAPQEQRAIVVFGLHVMWLLFLRIGLRRANDTQMLAIWGHI